MNFSSQAQQEATSSRIQNQLSDSSKIVSELDTASALGLTEKEAKKHLLKNQVQKPEIFYYCTIIKK